MDGLLWGGVCVKGTGSIKFEFTFNRFPPPNNTLGVSKSDAVSTRYSLCRA